MAIESVDFLPPLREIRFAPVSAAQPSGNFGAWLTQAVGEVNDDLAAADRGLQQLASGEAQNLHQVIIALEEARAGVQLLVQVRNRLLEAYQDVLRMQI